MHGRTVLTARSAASGRGTVALAVIAMIVAAITSCTRPPPGHRPGRPTTTVAPSGRWDLLDVPDPGVPGRPQGADLGSVECGAPTACTSTGSGISVRWDGESWVPGEPPPTTVLGDLSCPTAGWCLALGPVAGADRDSAWVWEAGAWHQHDPAPGLRLTGVSCVAVDRCLVVGHRWNRGGRLRGAAVALWWTAAGWQDVTSPADRADPDRQVADVSCSAETCLAVGFRFRPGGTVPAGALVERWTPPTGTGGAWVDQPVPEPPPGLQQVDCPGPDLCLAADPVAPAGAAVSDVVWVWRGGSWQATAVRGSGDERSGVVRQVTCASERSCLALLSGGELRRFDGQRWTADPADAAVAGWAAFVDCPTPTMCAAVGDGHRGDDLQPRLATWNGTAWTEQSSQWTPPGPPRSLFTGVSCVTRDACVAVGRAEDGYRWRSLTGRWDGRSWTVRPAAGTDDVELLTVTCPTAAFCAATGRTTPGQPVLRTWDGATWHEVAVPGGAPDRPFAAPFVACAGARFCLFVTRDATLAWDGAAWSPRPVAPPRRLEDPTDADLLYDLACASPDRCVLARGPVADVWDGAGWAEHRPPEGGAYTYRGVSCVVGGDCLVTTVPELSAPPGQPAILRVTDGAWAPVAAPPPNRGGHDSVDLVCASATECLAMTLEVDGYAMYHGAPGSWVPAPAPPLVVTDPAVSCVPGWCLQVGASVSPAAPGSPPPPARPAAAVFTPAGRS